MVTLTGAAPETAVRPRPADDTAWVGSLAGRFAAADLLAGETLAPETRRFALRVYAAACGDLARATPGVHDAWEPWYAALRTTARALSPAQSGPAVVGRALFHGARLAGAAPCAQQLRRGFVALLAAHLPEPLPSLVGEDLAAFRANDAAWLADHQLPPEMLPLEEGAGPPPDVRAWPTAALRPNPLNPRGELDAAGIAELAASFRAQGGVLQPLLVTPDGTVVAGHRRLAAARQVGLATLPVLVRALTPAQQLELLLVENLQRQDLSPLEEARAYRRLLAEDRTVAAVARAVGVSAVRVAGRLALLELDPQVQARVDRGELPVGVAPVLLPLRDPDQQRRLALLAVRRRLTVAQLRRLVDEALGALATLPPRDAAPSRLPPDDDPSGGGLSPTRQATLEALRARAGCTVSFGDLAEVAAGVCCACGMQSLPAICAACPLADLLHALLEREVPRAS